MDNLKVITTNWIATAKGAVDYRRLEEAYVQQIVNSVFQNFQKFQSLTTMDLVKTRLWFQSITIDWPKF